IGVEKIAATCSDSTIVTLKTRAEITQEIPTIVDLRDCCHHLHGIIGKITKLPRFVAPLANLKKIVAHFSKSTFSKAMLQLEDSDGHKLSALQKIGKTRFGTYWTSAQSLLPALPKIRSLVQARKIRFKVCLATAPLCVLLLQYHV
ncbi:hypothetical protein BC835DRAFT_1295844, partial [Cytidiella melzeri]